MLNRYLLAPLAALLLAAAPRLAHAQTGAVGVGTTAPDASAALDVSSTSKGLLPPRMSQAQRDAIASPATGLTVYNNTTNKLNTWNGTRWDESLSATEQPVGPAGTYTFNYTGSPQTFTVPAGITSLIVTATGGQGGSNNYSQYYASYAGGRGARVQATLAVVPGQVLTLYVGGSGSPAAVGPVNFSGGGYNGGGNTLDDGDGSAGGGGGASDVRTGSAALADRLLVAAGGGGAGVDDGGTNGTGGAGGAPNGAAGSGTSPYNAPGAGATQTSGNALGQGGGSGYVGGGGGGGYYGGGSARDYGGGGGGGSSYVVASGSSAVAMQAGANVGDGRIVITLNPPRAAPALDGSNFVNVPGDNLGNHTATKDLDLAGYQLVSGGSTGLALSSTGSLGIGTSSPAQKLDVQGGANVTGAAAIGGNTTIGGTATIGNNVGIGVSGLANRLAVVGTGPAAQLLLRNTGGGGGSTAALDFQTYTPGAATDPSGASLWAIDDGNASASLAFLTKVPGASANALAERLRIASGGNVGIGTTSSPAASAQLEVASTTRGFLPPRLSQTQRDAITSPATGLVLYNTTTNKLNTWNGTSWDAGLSPTEMTQAGPAATTFAYTGAMQTYTVPASVYTLGVTAVGAAGGSFDTGDTFYGVYTGGRGARVQATLAVVPGQVLQVYVGGLGGASSGAGGVAGGYNGGGGNYGYGGGGGGATDLRTSSGTKLLIAAGGGGAGNSYPRGTNNRSGGDGGAPNGGDAPGNGSTSYNDYIGTGATQTAGGNQNGTFGAGGNGIYGGGGGGGYYGGGGSRAPYYNPAAGAGGGSSWTGAVGVSGVSLTAGVGTSNGTLTLTPGPAYAAPALSGANLVGLPAAQLVGGIPAAQLAGLVPTASLGLTPAPGGVVFTDGTGLKQNGTQLVWDDANTRLGIGTSAPAQKLEVVGDLAPTSVSTAPQVRLSRPGTLNTKYANAVELAVGSYATGAGSQTRLDVNLANGLTNNPDVTALSVLGNGNVGIGTTTPGQKLEVAGGIKLTGTGNALTFPDGTTQTTAALANLTGDITSTGNTTTYNNVVPATKGGAGTVSGLLKANGNGTVSSAVAGTDYLTPASTAFVQNGTAPQANSNFNISGAGTVAGLLTAGSASIAGTATVGGRLGVGTGSPAGGLHITSGNGGPGTGTNTAGAVLSGAPGQPPYLELRGSGTGTTTTPYIDFAEASDQDYTTRLISIGGTLNVNGSNALLLKVNGNVQATNVSYTSDARFKQDVRPLGGALASVLALRGVRYRWNALGVQRGGTAHAEQVGVLAQEVEKIYPELVNTDKDGYKAVNYAQLTPVLIEALKEQQQQIEALKARAATAEAKATQATTEAAAAKAQAAQATATLGTFEARLRRLEAGTAQAQR